MASFVGVEILTREAPPSRGAPTDTSTWFVAGETYKGPITESVRVTSLTQFESVFGPRIVTSDLHPAVELFFRERGGVVQVARATGASVAATVTLPAADEDDSIVVTAANPGAWGNSLEVAVEVGTPSGFVLVITENDVEVDRSPALADRDAAVDWSANSSWVTVTKSTGMGSSTDNPDTVTATALTGGSDDPATDEECLAALDLHVKALGPGQESIPGTTSSTILEGLFAHAPVNNRIALGDLPDTSTVGTLTGLAAGVRAAGWGAYGGLFAPWVKMPTTVPGVTRTVPPSAAVAALISRVDRAGNPNIAAAGFDWPLEFASGPSTGFSDDDFQTLVQAGVNVIRDVYGRVEVYSFRTAAAEGEVPVFWQLSASRLRMAMVARAADIGERWRMRQIDRNTPAQFAIAIAAMLNDLYALGALFGDTSSDAFRVDYETVNTPETIAAGELHAVASFRPSPHAEHVVIELVSAPVTSTL